MEIIQMVIKKNISVALSRLPAVLVHCVAIVVATLPIIAQAQGQGWQFEPILKAGVETDDNASLSTRTDQEVGLTGFLADARADINYSSSDTTSFFLQPRVLIRSYPDDSKFDSDDFFLRSRFRHNSPTSTFGFLANFDQQSVRTAERSNSDLDIIDPDEVPIDDTGLVGLDGDRSRWRLSPFWNYKLSNVSAMEVGLDYLNTQYDSVFAGQLVDYTDARINLSYRRSFSNTTTGVAVLTGRQYKPDSSATDNNGVGLLAGFEYALSQKTRLTAMIGVENTDQSAGRSDSNAIGNITLTRDLETIQMFARYQRAVSGNGAGKVEVRDTVNMNFSRRLNQKISAGLGIRAYHAQEVSSTSSVGDRNYVQLQSKFSWYLTSAFIVEADYRYTVMDRSNAIGERSNSNGVGLWFVYQPKANPKL